MQVLVRARSSLRLIRRGRFLSPIHGITLNCQTSSSLYIHTLVFSLPFEQISLTAANYSTLVCTAWISSQLLMRCTILDRHLLERNRRRIFSSALRFDRHFPSIVSPLQHFHQQADLKRARVYISILSQEREIDGGFVCTSRMNSLIMAEKWTTHESGKKWCTAALRCWFISGHFFGALTYRAGRSAVSDHAAPCDQKLLYFSARCVRITHGPNCSSIAARGRPNTRKEFVSSWIWEFFY